MTAYVFKRKAYWKYGTEPNSSLITTGSISFENGIARGFSNTNYLSFNIGTTQKTDLVEINIAFNTGTWSVVSDKACGILGGDGFPEIQLYKGRSNIGGGDYIGSYVYSTNQDVEWKIQIQNGALAIFRLNPETNTYEAEGSVKVSSPATGIINIGRNSSTRYLKDGFVDITKLKVYVNGVLIKRFTETVPATKDDYDFTADKCYVLKRKRPAEYRKKVIDTATAGTYTFDVAKDRTAKIILVGAGGGGGYVWEGHADGSGGGSGACVYIKAKLTAGTYTITNGAGGAAGNVSVGGRAGGDSTLSLNGETLITAGGGGGGAGAGGAAGVGGAYTISDSLEIEKEYIVSNGNTGSRGGNMVTGKGGASVYRGYGKGANSRTSGTSGYIFVELTTDETDYDYKIDNDACYVLKRKQYWKYEYQDWTQPVLTANGTMGGSSFAVRGENVSSYPAYYAYDGNASTFLQLYSNSVNETFFYNSNPLKISKIDFVYYSDTWITSGEVYGCNDDKNYVLLTSFSHSTNSGSVDVNNEVGYKYFKIKVISANGGDGRGNKLIADIYSINITAQEQYTVPATKNDYDFITD